MRGQAVGAALLEEATEEEAQPFADVLQRLLTDEAALQQAAELSRARFLDFVTRRHGSLERRLSQLRDASTPLEGVGARELARRAGLKLVDVSAWLRCARIA